MRIESGKPSKNGGWLHPVNEKTNRIPIRFSPPRQSEKEPELDVETIMAKFRASSQKPVLCLSNLLGISERPLIDLGVVWSSFHQAWAFPMKDWLGRWIGIRLRNDEGRKWAVKGSKSGLFYAETAKSCPTVLICEGPTDTAAGMQLGFHCVGRPSCAGSEEEINLLLQKWNTRNVVISADNDSNKVGQKGAVKLQESLRVPSAIFTPTTKDLREFVREGGTRILADLLIQNLIWTQPCKKHNFNS